VYNVGNNGTDDCKDHSGEDSDKEAVVGCVSSAGLEASVTGMVGEVHATGGFTETAKLSGPSRSNVMSCGASSACSANANAAAGNGRAASADLLVADVDRQQQNQIIVIENEDEIIVIEDHDDDFNYTAPGAVSKQSKTSTAPVADSVQSCLLQIRYSCATIATDTRHTTLICACTKPDKVAGTPQTFSLSLLISNVKRVLLHSARAVTAAWSHPRPWTFTRCPSCRATPSVSASLCGSRCCAQRALHTPDATRAGILTCARRHGAACCRACTRTRPCPTSCRATAQMSTAPSDRRATAAQRIHVVAKL
jgi:hypothetical protein